ncbi:hypothetical protein X466_07680 [Oenococcus oeni S25]|uniref:DUF4044 domain-containing protein n=1 Tax=Oenococcus oeni TaxID=1247 RepID=UPI00050FC563|nr:DUF4044 domain-containing protein [Oenococcus oeni]KGO15845.1 hypothetical protein OA32_08760 [Oenococcus oeni X2L]KGH55731.1 hypothetical protein X463_05170 [Oenococcus oeni S22]KGH69388.1 hypothetical protein X466_07680 [Oenococcus oeni S25]KGH79545.1 hypothetical protein X281_09380 [Oenococcus oeni IOEB_0607]KGH90591.1 hypothetical protein X296_01770 [Oenococcus oeni IOEB_L26_1]
MAQTRKQEIRKQIRRAQNKPTPEEILAQRSITARRRVADTSAKSKKKSCFDYITITMAILMATITVFGIAIGLLTVF